MIPRKRWPLSQTYGRSSGHGSGAGEVGPSRPDPLASARPGPDRHGSGRSATHDVESRAGGRGPTRTREPDEKYSLGPRAGTPAHGTGPTRSRTAAVNQPKRDRARTPRTARVGDGQARELARRRGVTRRDNGPIKRTPHGRPRPTTGHAAPRTGGETRQYPGEMTRPRMPVPSPGLGPEGTGQSREKGSWTTWRVMPSNEVGRSTARGQRSGALGAGRPEDHQRSVESSRRAERGL